MYITQISVSVAAALVRRISIYLRLFFLFKVFRGVASCLLWSPLPRFRVFSPLFAVVSLGSFWPSFWPLCSSSLRLRSVVLSLCWLFSPVLLSWCSPFPSALVRRRVLVSSYLLPVLLCVFETCLLCFSRLRVVLSLWCPLPLFRHSLRHLPTPPLPGSLLPPPFTPYLYRCPTHRPTQPYDLLCCGCVCCSAH
jgi:hypothetical protein